MRQKPSSELLSTNPRLSVCEEEAKANTLALAQLAGRTP